MRLNSSFSERSLTVLLLSAGSLLAQVTVESGRQTQIPAAGATCALSIDQHIAEVSLEGGVLNIRGIDPGDVLVVALSSSGTRQIPVHVTAARPAYPRGFEPPQNPSPQTGSYETRFSSDPLRFENIVDITNRVGRADTQSHLAIADFANDPGHALFLPSAYFRMIAPGREFTFLDAAVNQSPLTVANVIVRGLHGQQGAWGFHGGYTNSADFTRVFVPTQKETVAGISRVSSWGKFIHITPGVYFMRSIDLNTGRPNSAFVASLLSNLDLYASWHIMVEVAESHSLAYAVQLQHDGMLTRLKAEFTQKKSNFPSLRTSTLPGLSGNASWTQLFSQRLALDAGANINDVNMLSTHQNSRSAFVNLRYKIGSSWSVGTGVNEGSFVSTRGDSVRTLMLPQFVSFDRPEFGASLQYQFSAATNSLTNGNGIRQTARMNVGRVQIGEYFNIQKDAPSTNTLLSQMPPLQRGFGKLSLTASTPDQMSALLQQAQIRRTTGIAGTPQIINVPRRVQGGGSLTWISRGPRAHHLGLTVLADHSEFITYDARNYNLSGTYAKEIGAGNQLQLSGSVMRSDSASSTLFSPLFSASFRHALFTKPTLSVTHRSASISGTVFVDPKREGIYQAGMETLPHVMVTLDDQRTVFSDASGHFRFKGVSAGSHYVALKFSSDLDHYFTSPNEVQVSDGSIVNFGIAFPKTDLWGYVKDDTGVGMADIELHVSAQSGWVSLTTDKSGKFILPDAQADRYSIAVNPESVPLGYSTEELAPAEVKMTSGSAKHLVIVIQAMRVLTGTVTIYDSAAGRYVPVTGAVISVPALHRNVTTQSSGRFALTGLPSGDLELKLVAGQSSFTQTICLSAQPVALHDDLSISSLTGRVASTVASADH